jgi:hypothetical protein
MEDQRRGITNRHYPQRMRELSVASSVLMSERRITQGWDCLAGHWVWADVPYTWAEFETFYGSQAADQWDWAIPESVTGPVPGPAVPAQSAVAPGPHTSGASQPAQTAVAGVTAADKQDDYEYWQASHLPPAFHIGIACKGARPSGHADSGGHDKGTGSGCGEQAVAGASGRQARRNLKQTMRREASRASETDAPDVTDEISSVPGDLLHADALRKTYGRSPYMEPKETCGRLPAKILSGDFYQLPPVPPEASLLAPPTKQSGPVSGPAVPAQSAVAPGPHTSGASQPAQTAVAGVTAADKQDDYEYWKDEARKDEEWAAQAIRNRRKLDQQGAKANAKAEVIAADVASNQARTSTRGKGASASVHAEPAVTTTPAVHTGNWRRDYEYEKKQDRMNREWALLVAAGLWKDCGQQE